LNGLFKFIFGFISYPYIFRHNFSLPYYSSHISSGEVGHPLLPAGTGSGLSLSGTGSGLSLSGTGSGLSLSGTGSGLSLSGTGSGLALTATHVYASVSNRFAVKLGI
jgi:hypothetical protein